VIISGVKYIHGLVIRELESICSSDVGFLEDCMVLRHYFELRLDVSAKQSLKVSDTSNCRDENVNSMSSDFLDCTYPNIRFRSEYDMVGASVKANVLYLVATLVKVQ
jgi:hypothetical protein